MKKNLKNKAASPQKLVDPLHPERPLLNRRDLLKAGLMSFAGSALVPSVAQLITSSEAQAADGCGGGQVLGGPDIPVVIIDCAGGAALAGNWMPLQRTTRNAADASFMSDYAKHGLLDGQSVTVRDFRFGAPMAAPLMELDPNGNLIISNNSLHSQIHQALTAPASIFNPDRLRIGSIAYTSLADSQSNEINPATLISKAGLLGTQIKNAVGHQRSLSGGNSQVADFDPAFRPLTVTNVDSLTTALSLGKAMAGPNRSGLRDLLSKNLSRLSDAQTRRVMGLNFADQFAALLGCAYQEIVQKYSTQGLAPMAAVDPRIGGGAVLNQIYGTANPTGNDLLEATLLWNCLKRNSGAATLTVGGCDYHTGNSTVGDAKDEEIGTKIAHALAMAHLLQTPVVVMVFSDGGIGADPTRTPNDPRAWHTDTAENVALIAHYDGRDGASAREMDRIQVGGFDNGVVKRDHPLAQSPVLVAHALFRNYLALCGKLDLYDRIATGKLSLRGISDTEVLLFKNAV